MLGDTYKHLFDSRRICAAALLAMLAALGPWGACSAAEPPLPPDSGQADQPHLWLPMDHKVLPHLADSTEWKTTIWLVNLDSAPAEYRLRFYQSGGAPLSLQLVGVGTVSEVSGTLPVNGMRRLETAGTSATLSVGFAILERLNGKAINGYGIFRQHLPERPYDFEAVAPFASDLDDDYVLPFDNSAGFTTSMAICNPSASSSATVDVVFYNDAGTPIGQEQLTLNPREHTAFATDVRWPATIGQRGVAVFRVSGGGTGAPVLSLRFNWTGPFTSTHTLSR